MFILELYQEDMQTALAVFESIDEGRAFLSKVPSYAIEYEDGFPYEYITAGELPDYLEIEHNNHIVPLSKFMFPDMGRVEIYWRELPNLSANGCGMVRGAGRVDAYSIANEDMKEYIAKRERIYSLVKAHLEKQGFETDRSFYGSEDGEAIVYKKPGSEQWHFLAHLDPQFCEQADALKEVDDILSAQEE